MLWSELDGGAARKVQASLGGFLGGDAGICFVCPQGSRPKLSGRTHDLKSAYKQFAVHGPSKDGSQRGWQGGFFSHRLQLAPVRGGGVRWQDSYIRQALWFVGYFGLGLMWSAFHDDCTLLSRAELESSSWAL